MRGLNPLAGYRELTMLTANVGNLSLRCHRYKYKLCHVEVEKRLAHSIQLLRPHVIGLQEVVHPSQCTHFIERNHKRVCWQEETETSKYQARRLVGDAYSIICDPRNGYECIAVRVDVGEILGCPIGALFDGGGRLDVVGKGCDPGFTCLVAEAHIYQQKISIINAHLHSRNPACRLFAIRQMFEGLDQSPALAGDNYTLILGDFNMDPYRDSDEGARLWQRFVGLPGSDKPFRYHSGIAEHNPPYYTARFLHKRRTLDHVVSNFATGVGITLGESPGTERLDGGYGTDHRALLCTLQLPEQFR